MAKKYGILIGRFQPMHRNHQALIDTIIQQGYEPIICAGSCEWDRDRSRNPLTFQERVEMIRQVYPQLRTEQEGDNPPNFLPIFRAGDYGAYLGQFEGFMKKHGLNGENTVVFYGDKEVDKRDLIYKGTLYRDKHYTFGFRDFLKIPCQEVVTPENVHATDIRKDFFPAHPDVDPRVGEWLSRLILSWHVRNLESSGTEIPATGRKMRLPLTLDHPDDDSGPFRNPHRIEWEREHARLEGDPSFAVRGRV